VISRYVLLFANDNESLNMYIDTYYACDFARPRTSSIAWPIHPHPNIPTSTHLLGNMVYVGLGLLKPQPPHATCVVSGPSVASTRRCATSDDVLQTTLLKSLLHVFFNSTLLVSHLFPCVAPNSMSSSSLWHFDALLATGACERIRCLRSIMLDILASPVIDEVLGELVHNTGDAMKLASYGGAVYYNGKGRDLGNYKYAFLYCSLHRLCRRGAFRNTE
jgi:hypothetical protein